MLRMQNQTIAIGLAVGLSGSVMAHDIGLRGFLGENLMRVYETNCK